MLARTPPQNVTNSMQAIPQSNYTFPSGMIPPGTETVLPPYSSDQLDAIRSELYRINNTFGLWDGIAACLVGDATFTGYSDYQTAWEYHEIWGTEPKAIWVGGRGSAKSQTSIDGYIKRMLLFPRTRITWVPGGIIDQNAEAAQYFENYFNNSPRLQKYIGEKWTETEKFLTNGSRIKFAAPTAGGVQSRRATVIHVDEAQALEPDIYTLVKFQATRAGAQLNLTGTAKADTLFHQTWNDPSVTFRMMTPVSCAVDAGIISAEVVIDHMNDPQLLMADKLEQLWCIWQRLSDRAFNPRIIHELPTNVVPGSEAWGIDFNPSAGHWAVLCVRLTDGSVLAKEERACKAFSDLLDLPPGTLYPEDGGTNTGYVEALVRENSQRRYPRAIYHPTKRADGDLHASGAKQINDHYWTSETKSRQVANVLRLQEHGQWLVYQPGCPQLALNASKIPFRSDGLPDKEKAEKLNLNAHVCDAAIHAINGACTLSRIELIGAFFGIN
ncbi:MAG: hypothetical protein Q6365_022230 [Candidatus Sigynarchaeota archaeon]